MRKLSFSKALRLEFAPAFCLLSLLSIFVAGCGGSSSNPVTSLIPEIEDPDMIPEEENPNPDDVGNNSLFSGKIMFSSSFGRPLKLFNFSTNRFELTVEGDEPQESLTEADLDPTTAYAAYTRTPADGFVTGKSIQVVLRDNSSNQEFRLPFETDVPGQFLLSSKPSVSSTGIVVFEYSTVTILAGGSVEIVNTGLAYWNGAGQIIKLADSVSEPSSPRITEDGNTVYFLADSDSGMAIWKTSLAADTPVLVWAPDSGESLQNVLQVFDISNDGSTIAFAVRRGSQNEILSITPNDQRTIVFTEPNTISTFFRLSGDGSTLVVRTWAPDPQFIIRHQLHVMNVADGSVVVAEDSTREGSKFDPFLGPALAVSFSGDGVALVNSEYFGDAEYSLFAFEPGEFSNAHQRIVNDEDYDGLGILALSLRFRGD